MVKNDWWITNVLQNFIKPFNSAQVNPCTYDFSWSGRWSTTKNLSYYPVIRTWHREEVKTMWTAIKESEILLLEPFRLYLLDTLEMMEIDLEIMGLLFLKSSIARSGLEHLHAGLFDPGYGFGDPSTGTLEIINFSPFPLLIKKGQPLVQMSFLQTTKPINDYTKTGRYNGSKIPTA